MAGSCKDNAISCTAAFQVAKRHALYKHVRAQLFNSGFSVTTTDSQDFKDAYTYSTAVFQVLAM